MSNVKIPKRWYLTEDKSRAVEDGDPDASVLLCPAGGEVPREVAARYGLLDTKPEAEVESENEPDKAEGDAEEAKDEKSEEAKDEPAEDEAKDEPAKAPPKARTAAPNKARRTAPNKSA